MNSAGTSSKVLSISERENEVLRLSGCNVVSEDEFTVVGGDVVLPWRKLKTRNDATSAKKDDESKDTTAIKVAVEFRTKFDVVELDDNGFVIDKGDEDFAPTQNWLGRRPGFEFKLGERGLGYYRTGKKVQVPSNTAY